MHLLSPLHPLPHKLPIQVLLATILFTLMLFPTLRRKKRSSKKRNKTKSLPFCPCYKSISKVRFHIAQCVSFSYSVRQCDPDADLAIMICSSRRSRKADRYGQQVKIWLKDEDSTDCCKGKAGWQRLANDFGRRIRLRCLFQREC